MYIYFNIKLLLIFRYPLDNAMYPILDQDHPFAIPDNMISQIEAYESIASSNLNYNANSHVSITIRPKEFIICFRLTLNPPHQKFNFGG